MPITLSNKQKIKTVTIVLLLWICFLLSALTDFSHEGYPSVTKGTIIWSTIIITITFVIFWILLGFGGDKKVRLFGEPSTVFLSELSLLFSLGVAVFFPLLFISQPTLFSAVSVEGHPVELWSAAFLFGGSFMFMLTFALYPKFARAGGGGLD